VPGYRVAGKTGTAYKVINGRYATDHYISSFIGMAPASDPRLIIAVMIDEPGGDAHYGGVVAGPVFAEVMAASLRQLNVAPDAPTEQPGKLTQTSKPVQPTKLTLPEIANKGGAA
jgi:cell division protein FtsI (penicillin-binding protein 3)